MRVTIESGGLRAAVEMDPEHLWEVLRTAATTQSPPLRNDGGDSFREAEKAANSEETTLSLPPPRKGGVNGGDSRPAAERIREIAVELLADGEFHPRREITAAVRAAGLNAKNVDNALKPDRFEKTTNLERRPAYRDQGAPRPDRHPTKPDWARDMEALQPAGGRIEVVGALGRNGDGSDG